MANLPKNIWLIMGHPLHLPTALALAYYFRQEYNFHLIISKHKYWKYIDVDEYKSLFQTINFFEPIYHSHSIKELIKVIVNLFRAKAALKKLPVQKGDVLISLEYWNYIENLMTTIFSKNKQILLCNEGVYPFISLSRREIREAYNAKITKSGWVHYLLVEPLLGLKKRTYDYWVKDVREGHGIAYTKKVESYFDKVFVLKSLMTQQLEPNELYFPYPILKNFSKPGGMKKTIVFFLSGLVSDKNYNQKVDQILQNLRRLYEDHYKLLLRLHPNQPESYREFDTSGWEINHDPGNSEQFLIRNANNIAYAFSDKSTGQSFSLNLGVPTYSFHRAMGLDKEIVDWHDKIYRDAPKEFFLEATDTVPKDYEPARDGLEKANSSLSRIFQEITKE